MDNDKTAIESFIEKRAMLYLPEDAIEIKVTATLYQNGELKRVSKLFSNYDIQKAFDDADNNYYEDTDTFRLTDNKKSDDDQILDI